MAINLFEGFTNPNAGETFRCISSNKESFKMAWTVQPGGQVPNEHVHYQQDELFYVKSGQMSAMLNGKRVVCGAGESINVPKGVPHIIHNDTNEPLECEVTFSPAYDMFAFFQCMGGLVADGDYDAAGQVNIPKMCYFMKKMKTRGVTRPTKIPPPAFRLVTNLFYAIGSLRGWGKLYARYVGR